MSASPPSSRLEDKPRAPLVGGRDKGEGLGLEFVVMVEEMDALPFIDPPFPPLTSRIALAPKLNRLPNGEVLGWAAPSPLSSIALSLVGEPEPLLDELSCRARTPLKGEVWLGEPERPKVEMDIRRF